MSLLNLNIKNKITKFFVSILCQIVTMIIIYNRLLKNTVNQTSRKLNTLFFTKFGTCGQKKKLGSLTINMLF